ncbi:probable protein phosphatase DDB_G0279461 [Amyelois transitella]|uniref:probable protein phosphatase DDB_G0279461 n=1 Tax=Amyelois transitella TaxID=680683 RepID=UPI0029906AA0|nr:probable protein phosphatase DDB_G0279461 [Amyelois transitella]
MITDIIGNNYEFPIRKTQSSEDENMDLNENITYMKVNSSLYNLPDKNDIQVLDNNNILQTDPIINDILHNEKEIKSESSKIILGDGYREKPEVNNDDEIITFIQSHDQFEYNYIKEIEHQDNSKEIEHQDNSKKIGDGINSKYVNDSSFSPEIENTLIENEDSNYLVLDTAGSDRWDNLNSQQEQNQVPIKNTAGDSGALDNIGVEHTLFIKNNDNDISLKPEYENISLHNEESPSLSINSQNVERLDNLISHEEQNQVSTKNQISDEIARDMDIKHNLLDSKRTFDLSGIKEEDFTGKNIRSNNDVKDQTQDPYNQFVKFQSRSHSKPISEINVQNSTFSFSQRDSKVKPDVINMDLAFHLYVNDQNQSVIKSLDTLKDIKRQPQDNVTIIKSQFKMFPKNVVKVPIDAHKYMMVQVVASDLQKPSSCPKPEENLSSVPETDVTQTKKQSQLCEKRELETFQTLLSKIYEKQLIPLQRLISDVKKDVDVLASQQLWLKENWHRTKRNNPKLTHSSRKCGCYKKC